MADKVTLVVIDRKVTEDVEKHPIFIQLENKVENLEDFIQQPDVNKEYKSLLKEPVLVNNGIANKPKPVAKMKPIIRANNDFVNVSSNRNTFQ